MGDSEPVAGTKESFYALMDQLIGGVGGRVLEIGAGRGRNFDRLRRDIEWIGLEPDPARRRVLSQVAAAHGHSSPILEGGAEQIPLPDASVDAVVARVVLCSVADQAKVLAEVKRVLKPGGEFIFFEHVAARRGSWSYWLQRAWAPFSRRFDGGCDPTRQTWRSINEAGFAQVDMRWFRTKLFFDTDARYIGGVAVTS
ncbi:hypothetical protein Rhe02_27500 [Rhizocola hellebori]|uniref:Methyltransferase type 11 domain-containing protein n=1 Tax=Rhizocola hellebori TaxID=1392758 RepID=A0A8J3Q606_9ACTN|nr:class I SAM-dependent methyltransferase [Rhizocola hellebori]GIH04683.1 hypothetical protein Rhe02_27500 [Rhizocola hellebori]